MKSASLPDGFFLGQIPPNWNQFSQGATWQDAHNNRVKVRIPGKHSKGNEICDKDLPWAIVEQSTSSGHLNGSSVALWGGEWVTGYFLDRDEQIPVITGVLGVNINAKGKIKKSACSTEFKPVSRFGHGGLEAQAHQVIGGQPPKKSANPSKEDVKNATKGIGEGSKSDAELEAEAKAKATADAQTAQDTKKKPGSGTGQSITGGRTLSRAEIGRYIDAGTSNAEIARIQAAVGDTPYPDQNDPDFRRTVSSTGEVNSSK